jgi:hypothetical protein
MPAPHPAPHTDSHCRPYVAAQPMSPDRIHIHHLVRVPIWARGQVICWDAAVVLANQTVQDGEPYYVVRVIARGAAYEGQEVAYYAYSIQCGLCVAGTDEPCPQCRPTSPPTNGHDHPSGE